MCGGCERCISGESKWDKGCWHGVLVLAAGVDWFLLLKSHERLDEFPGATLTRIRLDKFSKERLDEFPNAILTRIRFHGKQLNGSAALDQATLMGSLARPVSRLQRLPTQAMPQAHQP